MRIAMLINYQEREKLIFDLIAKRINEIDPDSSVCIVDFRDQNFMARLLDFQPETLLMFPLTARTTEYIPYTLKAAFKTRILFYRTEGIFCADSMDALKVFAGQGQYGPNCADGELLWGEENASDLAYMLYKQDKLSSVKNRIGIVGYVPFEEDFAEALPELPRPMLEKFSQFKRENIHLYLTGFHFADYTQDAIKRAQDIIPTDCNDVSSFMSQVKICLNAAKHFRSRFIKSILEIAYNNPDLLLVIKPHPLEIANKQSDIYEMYDDFFYDIPNVLYIKDNYHIIQLLKKVGLLVQYGSTSAAFANRYNIYNLYVEYPELYKNLTSNHAAYQFWDIKLDGDSKVHINNLPNFIHSNKRNFNLKNISADKKCRLKKYFNFDVDHQRSYSTEIAKILLSKIAFPYQEIDTDKDKFFFKLTTLPYIPHFIDILKQLLQIYKKRGEADKIVSTVNAIENLERYTLNYGSTGAKLQAN